MGRGQAVGWPEAMAVVGEPPAGRALAGEAPERHDPLDAEERRDHG